MQNPSLDQRISEIVQLREKAKQLHYELHEAMLEEFKQWQKDSGWEKRLNDVIAQIDSYSQQIEELEWEKIKDKKQSLEQLGFEVRTGHKIYADDEDEYLDEDFENGDSRFLIVHQSLPAIDYTNGYYLFDVNEDRLFPELEYCFSVVLGNGRTELSAWQKAFNLNRRDAFFLCPNHRDRLTALIQRTQKHKFTNNDPSTLYPKHIERLTTFLQDIEKIM